MVVGNFVAVDRGHDEKEEEDLQHALKANWSEMQTSGHKIYYAQVKKGSTPA